MIGENSFTYSTSFRIVNNIHLITLDVGAQSFGNNVRKESSAFEISGILSVYNIYY